MKLKKVLKSGFFSALTVVIGFQVACGDPLKRDIDDNEQLEIDITDIENYLVAKGYAEYDTLDFDVRALILEEGDGEEIEYGDIVNYHYIGRFLDGVLFDTSYPDLAFKQDTANADSLVFELDDNDNFVLDINGFPKIEYAEYQDDYFTVYQSTRDYAQFITTHTQDGWFVLRESNTIEGFNHGLHFTLENTRLGGKALAILPSQVGTDLLTFSQSVTFSRVFGPQPIAFEIRPIRKR